MLKLKLQYFGYLMRRVDLLEKTLMLAKIEGRRRRGQQGGTRRRRMRGLYVITDSVDMKEKKESEVTQSWPTLRDPTDCRLPGSFVHGIVQARVLEWGAIAFSTC